jgi:hypothetical protein
MTFEITRKEVFEELSVKDQEYVISELNAIIKEGALVSIQAEEFYENEVSLYGVYSKNIDEDYNYRCSGGLWIYSNPKELLETFTKGD